MPLPSILGGGCASLLVCVRVCVQRAGAGAGLAGTCTVRGTPWHPMVRRDGKGVPVYANLK